MKRWNDHPDAPCLRYEACLNPKEISYLCSIVEGHEGLAIVRTKDEALGIVDFWVPPLMRQEFEAFLDAVAREIPITIRGVFDMTPDQLDELEQDKV